MPLDLSSEQIDTLIQKMRDGIEKCNWQHTGCLLLRDNASERMLSQNALYKWLFQNDSPPLKMNCWEAVLVSGFNAHFYEKEYIKECLKSVRLKNVGLKQKILIYIYKTARKNNSVIKSTDGKTVIPRDKDIPKGAIVMWGFGEHVALSLGFNAEKHIILELDQPTTPNGLTSVEDKGSSGKQSDLPFCWSSFPTFDELESTKAIEYEEPSIEATAHVKKIKSPLQAPLEPEIKAEKKAAI